MIHVIATIEVAQGKREEFLKEFHQLVPLVRAEIGCIEYSPAVEVASGIAAQAPAREDVVVVVERWSDLEALKAHLVASHMTAYRLRVKEFVLKVQLHILQPV